MTQDASRPQGAEDSLETCLYFFTVTGQDAWIQREQVDDETLREVLTTLVEVTTVAATTTHLALAQRESLRRIEEKVQSLEADRSSISEVLRMMNSRLSRLERGDGG